MIEKIIKIDRVVPPKSMIVYKATNKINGKIYIGKTSQELAARIRRHLRAEYTFSKALRKYGLENFEFTIIDYSDDNDELSQKEQHWIAFYMSKGKNGYNMTDGGEGTPGWHHSAEVREKITIALTGKPLSEEHKQTLSRVHMGVPLSETHRKNVGLANLGKKRSEEAKARYSAALKGIKKPPLSEEHKRQISLGVTGLIRSEETRLKMSLFQKSRVRKPITDEQRKNQSIAVTKWWANRKQEVLQNGNHEAV